MDIHKIKIVGTAEIGEPLDIKKDYSVLLKRCSIRNIVKKQTNEDNNFIYMYSLENMDITTIIDEGNTIQGKGKSASKRLRASIYHKGRELGVEDDEAFYQKKINEIIINL